MGAAMIRAVAMVGALVMTVALHPLTWAWAEGLITLTPTRC
jgi:hypothetical protein